MTAGASLADPPPPPPLQLRSAKRCLYQLSWVVCWVSRPGASVMFEGVRWTVVCQEVRGEGLAGESRLDSPALQAPRGKGTPQRGRGQRRPGEPRGQSGQPLHLPACRDASGSRLHEQGPAWPLISSYGLRSLAPAHFLLLTALAAGQ